MITDKNNQWLVPVTVSTASSPAEAVHKFVLNAQEETVTVDGVNCDDWLKVIELNIVLVNSVYSKKKGRTLGIAPQVRQAYLRGAQVHGVHQAASHIPAFKPSQP